LGVFTFTSVQPSAGTLTVTFPTADASNAVFRIARDVWDYFSLFGIADAADSVDAVVEIKGMEIKSGFGL
jgi:hypothetical protein